MRIFTHTQGENDGYATVQLCAYEYDRLRKHFGANEECLDSDVVHIGRGTYLVKQGYGWYRVVNYSGLNWAHRILWAVDRLQKWHAIYEADRNSLIKQFISALPPKPATEGMLHQLAAVINERAHYA